MSNEKLAGALSLHFLVGEAAARGQIDARRDGARCAYQDNQRVAVSEPTSTNSREVNVCAEVNRQRGSEHGD